MSMDSFLSLFGPSADDDYNADDDDDDIYFGDQVVATAISSHPHHYQQHHHHHQHHHHPATPPTNHNRSSKVNARQHRPTGSNKPSSNAIASAAAATATATATAATLMDFDRGRLPPEPQLGNIEYKLKLIDPSAQRFEHLVTQMKWRLREGNGEAIYEIGVSDSGHLLGLVDADMSASLDTLHRMAQQLGATTTVLRRQSVTTTAAVAVDGGGGDDGCGDDEDGSNTSDSSMELAMPPANTTAAAATYTVAEVLVRKVPDDQHSIELRIAVLGSVGAGKSTLLGVLTQGERDNGRGRARLNMFRHMHEIRSGRTSCISHETLGFDQQGGVLNYAHNCELLSAEAIIDRASKLVTFMDLAGHRRYMRTTVQALTGYGPHQAMLVVGSSGAVSGAEPTTNGQRQENGNPAASLAAPPPLDGGTAQEHLRIVLALQMPFFIVVTKIDAAPPADTLHSLRRWLTAAGCRRVPLLVHNEDDVMTAAARQLAAGGAVVPIFCVSNVSGEGLDLVTRFLYVLPPGVSAAERERLEQLPVAFHVDEVFRVAGVGPVPVLGGLLAQGVLVAGQTMRLGPLADGTFVRVCVQTIHRNKVPCRAVRAGQSASLSIVGVGGDELLSAVTLRSGMALVAAAEATVSNGMASDVDAMEDDAGVDEEPFGSLFFQAKITVLYHATAIYEGFQMTVHIGSIRQTAVIEGIMGSQHIGTNDTASVLFRFVCHPEYVVPGMRVLIRDGTSKGVGHVTQVFPLNRTTTTTATAAKETGANTRQSNQ